MDNFPAAFGWRTKQVHYRSPLAREVSDLHATADELTDVVAGLERLLALGDTDDLQRSAWWTFAVMHYARLFQKGLRTRVDEHLEAVLADWPREARDAHLSFLGYRDKHLAHIVSDFDRAGVVVEVATRPVANGSEWSYRHRPCWPRCLGTGVADRAAQGVEPGSARAGSG